VLQLTEELVDRAPSYAVAAYIVRELSDLYYRDYPLSLERGYMSYSNMVRAFAELTNSGMRAYDFAWAETYDHRNSGGRLIIKTYYDSWRSAAVSQLPQESDFFAFLKRHDDSNVEAASKLSILERFQRGDISYPQYLQRQREFERLAREERAWLDSTGRI
jgi:hypothetical protein